jgi:hypothetical protein
MITGTMSPASSDSMMRRKRGNPNWGRPIPPILPFATEFERRTRELHLTQPMYSSSHELREWCDRNKDRVYIPEWLLKKWGMTVNDLAA